MDVGLLVALIGGALALLSPCSALLLPAFFASTVGSGPRLYVHAAVFYAGLITLLVPIGMGAGALGSLLMQHRSTIIIGASILLIIVGIAQIFGWGFDPAKLVPDEVTQRTRSSSGLVKSYLLGLTGGVAGFCAGPILGAVLTVAAAQGAALNGALLMAAYSAGMVLPLMLLAGVWHRLGERAQRLLRGKTFTVAGKEFHSTSVITGLLIIGVGILFWVTNGLLGLPGLLSTSTSYDLQTGLSGLNNPVFDIAVIVVLAAIVLVLWVRQRK